MTTNQSKSRSAVATVSEISNGDQRSDRITRERIEEIRVGYLQWARWTLWIMIAIVTIQIGFGIVSVYLYDRINGRFHDSLVIRCLDGNARHDDGLAELDRLIDRSHEIPKLQKDDLRRNNKILIDKLVPRFEDCEQRATTLSRIVN